MIYAMKTNFRNHIIKEDKLVSIIGPECLLKYFNRTFTIRSKVALAVRFKIICQQLPTDRIIFQDRDPD